jgi:hypothetical protein
MNRIRAIAAALALFFSATAANASLVMSWSFTGTGASVGINGSGTFTARGWDESIDGSFTGYLANLDLYQGAPYVEKQSDFYVMTGATGTINGKAISLMGKYAATYTYDGDGVVTSTTVTSGFQGNDNVVLEPYYNSEGELLNVNGYYGFVTALGVSVQDADGTLWNLFSPYNPGADGATYSPSYQFINSVDTFVDDDGFLNYSAIDGDFTLVTTSGGTVNPVPIPAAAWLFLSGVGGLFMAGRRRSALARAR